MGSTAVTTDRISRIVGYIITKGNFAASSPNLPQSIAILGEANDANQSALDTTPYQITSAQAAGDRYGYGSPIYLMARILFPVQGQSSIGGIPVWIYPQAKASGAQTKKIIVTPTGTATENTTHTIVVAGRYGMDGSFYDINIVAGDTATQISQKLTDAVNNILGSPVKGDNFGYDAMFTSKWSGKTADGLNISVDTNGNAAGVTYSVTNYQSGSGTPDVSSQLTAFGNQWNTIVINSYGTNNNVMSALESFNGVPDPTNPTGRFKGVIMKPFVALTGSVADNDTATTDAHLNDVTIAICPAPLSPGLAMEAAANYAVRYAEVSQNNPNLDIAGKSLPDMPTPTSIGTMASYDNRDAYVKKGNSTVDLVGGQYIVQDFVTTYHPTGENPPQFRYCRNLMLDFNVRYTYYLLEQINVVDHSIANDDDIVSASSVIKPKQWKSIINSMADDLANRSLIVDPQFMKDSITVSLSTTNPDRLETFFMYKRSGFVRIASTTAEAGFNFGKLN